MPKRTIILKDGDTARPAGYVYISSGYLVEHGKVLLVHHNVFDKWVPPGGHIDAGDTFAAAAAREFEEETGLPVVVLSAVPASYKGDDLTAPEPVPFHVDLEFNFRPDPAIIQFYWVRRRPSAKNLVPSHQAAELFGIGWFSQDQLKGLQTFEQVRALASYALSHHPDASR